MANKKATKQRKKKVLTVDVPVLTAQQKIDKLFAQGVAIHSVTNTRTATTFLADVNDLNDANLDDRSSTVALARKLRRGEGICSSVADLLADFAITDGRYHCDNKQLEDLLNLWSKFVNSPQDNNKVKGVVFPTPGIRAASRKIFDDFITDGDAITTLFWEKNVKMRSDFDPYFLPVSIKGLDSLALDIDSDLAKFGIERLTYKINDRVKDRILKPKNESDKFLSKRIPKEWLRFIKKKKDIILDPNVTFHIKRNAKDYKPWGESLFIKAFTSVSDKRRLQAVDAATIDGMINRLTIFMLGLEDKDSVYHIPSGARVNALIEALTNSKRSNAIVWPGPDLQIKDIGPEGKILEMKGKYDQADKDILRALHISPLLIDGGFSGKAVADWAAVISTEVGVDYVRSEIQSIFTRIGREIALANEMEYTRLEYQYDTQLLKDEKRVRNFALRVHELGGLSNETFVTTMGYNFEEEKARKLQEKSDGTDDLFTNFNAPGMTNPKGNRDDGRPINTPNDLENKDLKTAGYDSVTLFYELFLRAYKSMQQSVQRMPDIDSKQLMLASGFGKLQHLIESQLRSEFVKQSGGHITKDFDALIAWSNKYFTSFYKKMKEGLQNTPDNFDNIMRSNEYRILMYATEGHRKAYWVGQIAKARIQGLKVAKWVCISPSSSCSSRHGKDFELDTLIDIFPGHPNCTCLLEFGG